MKQKRGIIGLFILIIVVYGCEVQIEEEIIEEDSGGSGIIVLETNPERVDVYLDGEFVGVSPIELYNILIGSHDVVLRKDGYEDSKNEINVEAGKKTSLSIELNMEVVEEIYENVEEELREEEFEEDLKSGEIPMPKKENLIEIGTDFLLYYEFTDNKFTAKKQSDSDVFSKRFDSHLIFTRYNPVKIEAIEKSIDEIEKEDCLGITGTFEYLYSGHSLCVITKDNEIVAIGGEWEDTENAVLKLRQLD